MRFSIQLLLLCASSQALQRSLYGSSFKPASLQTGPDVGSSFAAAALYNPSDETVVIVGTTYGKKFGSNDTISDSQTSSCFLASLSVANSLQYLDRQTLQTANVHQACTNLLLHGNRIFATGYSEPGGLLESQAIAGNYVDVKQYGMMLDIDNYSGNQKQFIGGYLLQQSAISYPVAVHGRAGDGTIYVLSMQTESAKSYVQQSPLQSMQDPARFFMNGATYDMVITQLQILDISNSSVVQPQYGQVGPMQTLKETWISPHGTTTGASVHVAGIQKISDELILVVGTTAGYGDSFGIKNPGGTDLDGFITKISPANGKLAGNMNDPSNPSSARLQSIDQRDDWITGMCHNPRDSSYVYIVGATRGRVNPAAQAPNNMDSVQAFLSKVSTTTLTATWTHQLGAPDSVSNASWVRGVSCTISPDGGSVFYGGIVESDAVLDSSGTLHSYGGDDVFVAKIETSTGQLLFVRQIGSERDDELAMRGGLTTDVNGNVILVGNTFGSIYRTRTQDDANQFSDVFVSFISGFNGDLVVPVATPTYDIVSPGQDPGTEADFVHNTDDQQQGTETMPHTSAPTANNNQGNVPGVYHSSRDWKAAVAAAVSLCAFALLLTTCCCWIRRRKALAQADTDRTKVLTYLNEFDVEDVDLKHSATGGWHCSYDGPLAHGINNKPNYHRATDDLTSPLTGANRYVDSLFRADNDCYPRGGLDDNDDLSHNSIPSYVGLMDAYNATLQEHGGGAERLSQSSTRRAWRKSIV